MKRLKKYNKLLAKRILTLKIFILLVDAFIVYGMIKKLKITIFFVRVIMQSISSKSSSKNTLISLI